MKPDNYADAMKIFEQKSKVEQAIKDKKKKKKNTAP